MILLVRYSYEDLVKRTGGFTGCDHADEQIRENARLLLKDLREGFTFLYLLIDIQKHSLRLLVCLLLLKYVERPDKRKTCGSHRRQLTAYERYFLGFELVLHVHRVVCAEIAVARDIQIPFLQLLLKILIILRHLLSTDNFSVDVGGLI